MYSIFKLKILGIKGNIFNVIEDVGFEAFIFIFKFFVCLIGVGWDFFNPFKRDVKTRFRCIYITYIYIKTVIYLCHFNLFWISVFWIQQGGRLRTNERNHPQSAASFIGEKLHLNWINLILFVFFLLNFIFSPDCESNFSFFALLENCFRAKI